MRDSKFRPHPLLILNVVFTLLVLMHSSSTPLFEAPDEVWHYAYARWVAEERQLPAMDNNDSGANQEVAQPPLYYGLAALLGGAFPDENLEDLLWGNPGFGYQAPGTTADNKNMLIHTANEGWPWHGAALAIHITRLTSLLFGLLALNAAWGVGYETFGSRRGALVTAAVVAFHPQFVFLCSVVNNDSAAAALATATLWALARTLRRGATPRRAALTGLLAGLAILTKTSALPLLPLAGVTFIWKLGQKDNHGVTLLSSIKTALRKLFTWHSFKTLLVYCGVALAAGGWWYARNLLNYGDLLGISSHVDTPWGRTTTIGFAQLLPELPALARSFFAGYGWGHVTWPEWIYWALWSASAYLLIRSTSTLWQQWRSGPPQNRSRLQIFGIAAVWFGGILALLLYWMRQVEAPHGRLLFPALGAWALWLAADSILSNRKGAQIALKLYLTFLATLSALAPGARIWASFAPPRRLSAESIVTEIDPLNFVYGDTIRLLGVDLAQNRVKAGEGFAVKTCWEALAPTPEDYTVFIHLIGAQNSRVAERHTYPGLGRFPTSLWPEGYVFCDSYHVSVETWAAGPIRYQLQIGLFNAETDSRPAVIDANHNPVASPIVAQVVVEPQTQPAQADTSPPLANFANGITLRSFDTTSSAARGSSVEVTLYWESQDAIESDFIAFVHLWEPGSPAPLAQHDAPPAQGWSPTSIWRAGDQIRDLHRLDIPIDLAPGEYPLWVGLYHADSKERVSVSGLTNRFDFDLVPLGTLKIEP